MFDTTEISKDVYRISMWDEGDMVKAGICFEGVSYNMFLVNADEPVLIQTMFKKTFRRFMKLVDKIIPSSRLAHIVVPHHIGDSSGALPDWLKAAPKASVVCSPRCASSSLKDLMDKDPKAAADGDTLDLGSHRLKFLLTPWVDQWDSLMTYEETTGTLFPNDLFSTFGTDVSTRGDYSDKTLKDAAAVAYLPHDQASLHAALEKIQGLSPKVLAPMHGASILAGADKVLRAFRTTSVYPR